MSDETTKDVEARNEEYKKGRTLAMSFGGAVYVGVVIAATVLYISFILLAFPSNAYVSRAIMGFAGLLVGGSMIAFPIALHLWAVERIHRAVTTVLYYVEMGIIGVNVVVAFMSLLSKYAGYASTPEWVVLYEPFSIGAIVYTLIAWGTVFRLDPEHKRRAKDLANQEKLEDKISKRESEFLDSIEGEDVIQEIAELRVREKYNVSRYKTGSRHWGSGRKGEEPKQLPQSETPLLSDNSTRMVNIPEDVYKRLIENSELTYPVDLSQKSDPTKRQ